MSWEIYTMIRIEHLAAHQSLIPTLARWQHAEWQHFHPDETVEGRATRLRGSARRDGYPITYVALSDGELLGSASLVAHDMDIRRDLTPWLADLYVAPAHRRRGVGSALVRRVLQEAAQRAVETVHLFTTNQENERLYASLGWSVRERVDYLGKRRVVMTIRAQR